MLLRSIFVVLFMMNYILMALVAYG